MSVQKTSKGSHSVTCLQGLEDGPQRCDSLPGQMTFQFSLEAALASHSPQREPGEERMTNVISGRSSCDSSELANPALFSGSRSPVQRSSELSEAVGQRLREMLPSGSMEYQQTWKLRATPLGRQFWAHMESVPRTFVLDFISVLTLKVSAVYCKIRKQYTAPSRMLTMKICSKCKIEKASTEFGPEKRSADRLRYSCRECDRERSAAYNAKNREKRNAAARARRLQYPEIDREYEAKYRRRYVWRTMLQHAKKRAEKFGWEYDLDDHVELVKARVKPMVCEMTGASLVSSVGVGSQGKRFWNTPSLDRIDPAKGYTYENIRIVCWAMNCAMGTWGESVLRELVTAWRTR
jgi:hypothetical protein